MASPSHMTYVGLPITLARTRRVHRQFVFDRIKAKLAGWKGKLMNHVVRCALARSVIGAIPVFGLTAICAPAGFFKDIYIICRKFLWAQEEKLTDGKCKVRWSSVCSPGDLGGLNIHDIDKFECALRLRWL